jgi:hypothetical protein
MESTIRETTLTDGSKTYAVIFGGDTNQVIVIECFYKKAADKLQTAITLHACEAIAY